MNSNRNRKLIHVTSLPTNTDLVIIIVVITLLLFRQCAIYLPYSSQPSPSSPRSHTVSIEAYPHSFASCHCDNHATSLRPMRAAFALKLCRYKVIGASDLNEFQRSLHRFRFWFACACLLVLGQVGVIVFFSCQSKIVVVTFFFCQYLSLPSYTKVDDKGVCAPQKPSVSR